MSFLNKIWYYLKKYWKIILFGLSVLFVILGYVFMKRSKENIRKAELKKQSLNLKKEIELLKGKREAIEKGLGPIDADLELIDKAIASKKVELKRVDSKYKNLKLEEVIDKYDKLGY